MRPQKVLDKEILAGLKKVFRNKGYEGASLAELAEATGLKKASLYHRFPNGKEEMAAAVLEQAVKWGKDHLLHTLSDETIAPKTRLKKGLTLIKDVYQSGKENCIFRAISMKVGLELFEQPIKNGMQQWVTAFKNIGVALKFSPRQAEKMAMETLIEIHGSLVVARCFNDTSIFEKTIKKIENKYLGK